MLGNGGRLCRNVLPIHVQPRDRFDGSDGTVHLRQQLCRQKHRRIGKQIGTCVDEFLSDGVAGVSQKSVMQCGPIQGNAEALLVQRLSDGLRERWRWC